MGSASGSPNMAIIRDGQLVDDNFLNVVGRDEIPAAGAIVVSLEQWTTGREALLKRGDPVGIRLQSDEHPEVIADDLDRFDLIELEFPAFRDGRAYSYARLLRDRFGFTGELRAVGDVLLEQLHYMSRVGFSAFELNSDSPLEDYETAQRDFSVWYQPATDDRPFASQLRHSPRGPGRRA